MNRYLVTGAIASIALASAALSQPLPIGPRTMVQQKWGVPGPWVMANLARHQQAIMHGIPSPYDTAHDGTADTPEKLTRGGDVFARHCLSCHGSTGVGNGPAGSELAPPPANLAWLARVPMSDSDPYMAWTVAEGGQAFQSDMPAFKDTLSESDRWAVIAYIRNGLSSEQPR
jgi:mono/diheme cytochrome c family protein